MNTGSILMGHPSVGSWVAYGLGSENHNMPSFVVLPDPKGLPYNAKATFSSGFLPAQHQGTMINVTKNGEAISDLFPDKRHTFAGGDADDDGSTEDDGNCGCSAVGISQASSLVRLLINI